MKNVKEVIAFEDVKGDIHKTKELAHKASYDHLRHPSLKNFEYEVQQLCIHWYNSTSRDVFHGPQYLNDFIINNTDILYELIDKDKRAQREIMERIGLIK